MGPGASGMMPTLRGKAITNDDGRPQNTYVVRFRNITDKHPDFIRGYGMQGGSGAAGVPVARATTRRASGRPSRRPSARTTRRRLITLRSARCSRAARTRSRSIPR